ncbi:MAG: cytochrome c5 family protein, partial [Burkholderiales bacterium]
KIGDNAAWAARITTGYDALLNSVLKGKGAMGAQAGGAFSDVELARAMVHMVNASGGKLAEPAVEAAAPAVAEQATPAATSEAPPAMPASGEQPVVVAAAPVAAPAPAASVNGQALYNQACAVCHVAGVAGAPKLGDKAGWAARLGLGLDGLTASVVKGKGAMPPKGGAANASEAEIRAAVQFMLDSVN